MIVMHKLSDDSPEVPFAEGHDSREALGLGGPDKPLGKRVRLSSRLHRLRVIQPKPFTSRIPSIRCMGARFD